MYGTSKSEMRHLSLKMHNIEFDIRVTPSMKPNIEMKKLDPFGKYYFGYFTDT